MMHLLGRTGISLALSLLIFYSGPGRSDAGKILEEAQGFEILTAVDNGTLEEMRGGYDSPEGIHFDIGIGKATYIDGILQLQSSTNAIYNGAGISAENLQDLSSELTTVIQNNLNNRFIQNYTVMDVSVKNMGGFLEAMKNLQDIGAAQTVQVSR